MPASGHVQRGDHPGLRTVITQAPGEEPLKAVEVTLPRQFKPEIDIIARTCRSARLQAGTCPPSSRIGSANVSTPLVPGGLRGPVRLALTGDVPAGKSGTAIPYAVVELAGGGLALRLDGAQRFLPTYRLRTTFSGLPAVPVTRFELRFFGGKAGSLRASRSFCVAPPGPIDVRFTSQDGRTVTRRTRVEVPACAALPRVTATWSGFAGRPSGRVLVRRGTDGARLRRIDVSVPRTFRLLSTRHVRVRVDGRVLRRSAWSVDGARIRVHPPGNRAGRVEVVLPSSSLATRRPSGLYGDRHALGVVTPFAILDVTGRRTDYELLTNATR